MNDFDHYCGAGWGPQRSKTGHRNSVPVFNKASHDSSRIPMTCLLSNKIGSRQWQQGFMATNPLFITVLSLDFKIPYGMYKVAITSTHALSKGQWISSGEVANLSMRYYTILVFLYAFSALFLFVFVICCDNFNTHPSKICPEDIRLRSSFARFCACRTVR